MTYYQVSEINYSYLHIKSGVVCPKYEKLCHVFRAEYSQYVESCRLCIDMNYTLMSNEQITDNLAIIVHLLNYIL